MTQIPTWGHGVDNPFGASGIGHGTVDISQPRGGRHRSVSRPSSVPHAPLHTSSTTLVDDATRPDVLQRCLSPVSTMAIMTTEPTTSPIFHSSYSRDLCTPTTTQIKPSPH